MITTNEEFTKHFIKYYISRFLLGILLFGYVMFHFITTGSYYGGVTPITITMAILDFFFYPFSLYLLSSLYAKFTDHVFKYPRLYINKQKESGYYKNSNGDYVHENREKISHNGVFLFISYVVIFMCHFLLYSFSIIIGIAGIILVIGQKNKAG